MDTIRRLRRLVPLAACLGASALLLSACIAAPVTASGSGTVAISWADTAQGFDPGTGFGNALLLCAPGTDPCDLARATYAYYPADGSTGAVLSPGVPVGPLPLGSAGTSGLPSGTYTLVAWGVADVSGTTRSERIGEPLLITIGASADRDLTIWYQSTARTSATQPCPVGWRAGWAQWPNDRAGGYVCNREVYAYYPDEPVIDPSWAPPAGGWLTAVARASATDECPVDWTPSWAQWPNDGAGGYVCVTTTG